MTILKTLFGDGQSSDLLAVLTDSGFSMPQAKAFLPVAGERVAEAASGMDLSGTDKGNLIEQLSQRVDIEGIASKLGIDSNTVSNGLSPCCRTW